MYLLAIDTETTGFDTENDDIIELGYALYDTKRDSPLIMHSNFIMNKIPLSDEVVDVTGITQDDLDKFGKEPSEVFLMLTNLVEEYDINYFVAHNGVEYDLPIIKNNFVRAGMDVLNVRCIDTKMDLPLKYKPRSTSLSYMAADHGFINPFPHRALTDAMTCMKLLKSYNLMEVLEVASTPLIEIRADVNYDNKDKAKARGYYWDAERKVWLKKIREFHLKREEQEAQFQVLKIRSVGH